ncbi:translation initiation factor IF-2 [Buchnera aphidicola]|jgi:translation initiation factor IF-2|uniref:Translation initiation factor IF-2 n=1 Tax=Buchnera aphidicola subsp. Schizaphis graminum (strain Sg) TaxID=198804 RepID=IF2_BUCAP|nr:translation initiation factor IF-2 [Buchnera aphidicola]Q8K9H1.1 RecName: Full=Translation initiation factor IF-2 [Buchnera aphidicola str. Sg (Schizaphis graminum)]AAM67918.1 initiation factor IF-2 [Buchnera aphidicola str. Sg (Schizaphis graminum)]AWI49589.1 translation initiation factor IF-2 [Buchnera aphidicola (Schizaphis graminum)]
MVDISLKILSNEMKISIKELIKTLSEISISKTENDCISITEKKNLLKYLESKKKPFLNTFILQRKTRSTLNVFTPGGKNKSVQIEIRKKRMYLKNNKSELEPLLKNKNLLQNKEKNNLKSLKNTISKAKESQKNIDILEESKANINFKNLNKLTKSNVFNKNEKNKSLKKNINFNNHSFYSKKTIKNNTENQKLYKEEKKDYHLTTFIHNRNTEDNRDREIEKNKRNFHRNIKNYRQKKNNKQNNQIKSKKDEVRISKNRKNVKQKNKSILLQQVFKKPESVINRDVVINGAITVCDLANKMAIKSSEVIKNMMNMGIIGTINHVLDQDTAQLIAEEMGHKVILRRENELEELIMKDRDTGNNISLTRAPVVTIMGHVDHGKTSLLDYIRSTKVASSEAGGITQNIGAYHVTTDFGSVTFLDTPGHSAFTGMRSRGVKITDIVVLVVAADDGVKPQTIEAIQHAKEANVPIIVAINKIDKVDSNIDQIKNDLTKYNILSEEWGGENIFVLISAKTGKGIDNLLNAILLQSEILELKAISTGMAEGVVIESFLDKGRGPIATVLVQKGNLKKGDIILCGFEYGRIKVLRNENGKTLKHAGPSMPVEVLGLSKVPFSGEKVTVVRDEKKAKEVASYRKNKSREIKLANQNRSSLENMFKNIKKNDFSELKIIIKSDVQGSLEAISSALFKLSTNEVKVNIIGSGIGGITETDASLALASNAIILGFNVRADASAKKIIDLENLDLRYYSVIYDLLNEVKAAMTGLLSPQYKQNIIGLAEVRNIFKSPKFGLIAGCMVTEGIIKRNNPIRILRNNVVVYEGELESLRRFKEDINEIRNGMECGIGIKNYHDLNIGDVIEVFEVKEIKRIL